MKQICLVVQTESDRALLETTRQEACKQCDSACTGCEKKIALWVENPLGAKVGDRVEVEDPSHRFLLLCSVLFLLPALLGIGALGLALAFFSESAGIALGVGVFAISFLAAIGLIRNRKWNLIRISRILEPEE